MRPTSRLGRKLNVAMISSPSMGGWKLRTRSFSSMSISFCFTRSKFSRKRFTFSWFLLVISALHKVIKSSMSSPASKSRRRTAESVTPSSTRAMGRMCNPTSFFTYFMCSLRGRRILPKIFGTIFSPIKLWL